MDVEEGRGINWRYEGKVEKKEEGVGKGRGRGEEG